MKSVMTKHFNWGYTQQQMEQDYINFQHQASIERINAIFSFALFYIITITIPSFIKRQFLEPIIAFSGAVSIIIVRLLKVFPRHLVNFLIAIIFWSFNCAIFVLPSNMSEPISKTQLFLNGFVFASINFNFLSQFANLKQKIFFLIYAFVVRFSLLFCLDAPSEKIDCILQGFYVDTFIIFLNICQEKRQRQIFKQSYENRQEMTKYKNLIDNCLPQSIAIAHKNLDTILYSNKPFSTTFDQPEADALNIHSSVILSTIRRSSFGLAGIKPQIKLLQADKSSIRELGSSSVRFKSTHEVASFQDVFEELIQENTLEKKPLTLLASYSYENETRKSEIILKKLNWGLEDAVAIIINDITEQEKQIKSEIFDANIDKLISTISHELRTPLNGILGTLEIVEKRVTDQKTAEYLSLCQNNAYLLLNLVNSVLDLHQARQGKLSLHIGQMNIKQTLEETIKLFAFQCNQKGVSLNMKLGENIPEKLYNDENRLKQILTNLIGNSIKFTSEGSITVEVGQDPIIADYLQISVSDTGIGINEEEKSCLFSLQNGGRRHRRSVTKNGAGLGLTISNILASILGGNNTDKAIEVTSTVKRGSKFAFKIRKDLRHLQKEDKAQDSLEHYDENESDIDVNSHEELRIPKEFVRKHKKAVALPFKIGEYAFQYKPPSSQLLEVRTPVAARSPLLSPESSSDQLNKIVRLEWSGINLSIKKRCILAVDDNPFNLLVVENLLRELGYSCEMAQSGQEAIEKVKLREKHHESYQAILMDCQMPIMDGFETTRLLKTMMEKGEVQKTPIVALTANDEEDNVKQCFESGMVGHLSKPVFAKTLKKTLAEWD